MKILLESTAPFCPSGYGVQTNLFAAKLIKEGYDVIIMAHYGLQNGVLQYNLKYYGENYSCLILPTGYERYGYDIVKYYFDRFKRDLIITLCDVYILQGYGKRFKRWIPYFPIDHTPASNTVLNHLKGAWKSINYSKFAVKQLKNAGIYSEYIPLGFDPISYYPLKKDVRNKCKKILGFDEKDFVFGIVAANSDETDRKQFDRQLRAFQKIHKKYPDTKMYIHSSTKVQTFSVPLVDYIIRLKLDKAVKIINKYEYLMSLNPTAMNKIYNSMDVLMCCSAGEGFGLPIIEAQAVGLPAIVSNFSSMPELVGAGELVRVGEPELTLFSSFRKKPVTKDIVKKMEKVYLNLKKNKNFYKDKALKWVKNFEYETIWEKYWVNFLKKVEKDL